MEVEMQTECRWLHSLFPGLWNKAGPLAGNPLPERESEGVVGRHVKNVIHSQHGGGGIHAPFIPGLALNCSELTLVC